AVAGVREFVTRHGARVYEGFATFQVDAGALDVRDGGDHLRLSASAIGLRLPQDQLCVRVVDHDENVAASHVLAVDDLDLHHGSFDFGGYLRHFGRGVGVVGAHVMRTHELPVLEGAAAGGCHGQAEQREESSAL